MNDRDRLMIRAIQRDGLGITPCGKKFSDCYTENDGQLVFWYNTPSGTTRSILARSHRQPLD